MLNLDELSIEELQEVINKAEANINVYAKELFPDKPAGFVKAVNQYVRYAKEKIEAMQDRSKGRLDRAQKHEEKASMIYHGMPEYSQWDNLS